ncbi:NAD(+) hydrolase sarm1-like isoform X1 [Leptidea sinapis]|uniref:NAD(+) hydrolase sarm1-like isoform X1 n=2 Tax=Leptidea sinapis TaxID=189913 RepID=UPI0021C4B550|nr:NAD(+) hydrolase sarm1-like isoform X1 [Leptidea sinapis]
MGNVQCYTEKHHGKKDKHGKSKRNTDNKTEKKDQDELNNTQDVNIVSAVNEISEPKGETLRLRDSENLTKTINDVGDTEDTPTKDDQVSSLVANFEETMRHDNDVNVTDGVKKNGHVYRSNILRSEDAQHHKEQSFGNSNNIYTANQRLLNFSQKASSLKSNLTELKSSISEMKNLSNSSAIKFGNRHKSSLDTVHNSSPTNEYKSLHRNSLGNNPKQPEYCSTVNCKQGSTCEALNSLKYSSAQTKTACSTSLVRDGCCASQSAENSARSRNIQHGDVLYSEQSAAGATQKLLQAESLSAEKSTAYQQDKRTLQTADLRAQEVNNVSSSCSRLQTGTFSAERKGMASSQALTTVSSNGIFNHKEHSSVAQSNMSMSTKNISTSATVLSSEVTDLLNGTNKPIEDDLENLNFEDLDNLNNNSNQKIVDATIRKYTCCMKAYIFAIKNNELDTHKATKYFNKMNEMIRKSWAVPTYGHELGNCLCNTIRTSGGLDLLMEKCMESKYPILQFASANILEQCLTTENRDYVVKNGLEKVVNVACVCTKNANVVEYSRVGTGILEHLFKHSECTCSDVIRLGGLDAVLFECRKNDIETLRHCATALANLSLYGGADNQEAMIKRKVPMWLFPLAFHNDDNIKYYACLAIAVLVANKEIEAAVLSSGTLDLVEPFVTSHNPSEFAKSNLAHAHGQSKSWLQRLVPVLSSKREEARNLAAFHFCMEAGIKKQQCNTEIFREINAIEPLMIVAGSPNAVASKYAAQALRLIGEEVPHKLSQQVPLWSIEDVREWVKQIGFTECADNFYESKVDGDLLLQITEDNLKYDIGLDNGIKRKRFARELQQLKKMADYSLRDTCSLQEFLQSIGAEYTVYTYSMLNAGVDRDSILGLSDEQLENECRIKNSIHRLRILNAIRDYESRLPSIEEDNLLKNIDVFISYRRSNGSQLASLLKVHLHLRGFTIFIDVETREPGNFEDLLESIQHAKHFLLVLTPNALDKCKEDYDQKDCLHREVVAALNSQCNIVPIIDNFVWPEPEELPEDMQALCFFNGIRWIHDYQDACVDKLECFLRGGKSNIVNRLEGPFRSRAESHTPMTATMNRSAPNYTPTQPDDSTVTE